MAAHAANFNDWPLQPNDLLLETFKEEGRGSDGVVHVGEWRGRSVAVKMVHEVFLKATGQNAKLLEKFKEECHKLRGLEHRRVVRLIDTFRDERGRPLLVMEALEESLESYLLGRVGNLAMVRQITIVNEMAEGLAYLHENKIVHRDLKPANVLVGKDGCIRIADLGQAKLLENIEMLMQTPQPGTVLFLPPEALRGDGSDSYTFSIDCFSLGVIALCVATQSLPTCGLTEIGTVEEAVRRKNDLDKLPTGHPLEAIILGCLQNTQSLRPRSFFIKEHTQALLDKLSLESQLETKSRTVIELRQDLDSEKRRAQSLQMDKLVFENRISALKEDNVDQVRLLQERRVADKAEFEARFFTLQTDAKVFENRISALKEDNAKYVDQVRLLQERRVADKAEFEARFQSLQTNAKVKIDSCRDNLTGILGLLANFDTNLQPFPDWEPSVVSKQSSLPTPAKAHLSQESSAVGKSPQAVQAISSLVHPSKPAVDDQMLLESHQVPVPLAKSHCKLVVGKGNILYANADIKIAAISSPQGLKVGKNASLDRALDGLLQQTLDRRYQSRRPDKYDVFTVRCPPNSKANCRFLVVANIVDHNLGRRSDAPKFLQQILHSVCREVDTLEMPTAAIAPGSFDCGGFPKDSILPAFMKMLNEYNFTEDVFLTEVSVLAMSDDEFSVLVQSAERAPLLQTRNHPPRPSSQPTAEGNPATGSSFVASAFSHLNPFRSGSSNDKVQNEPPSRHTKSIPSTSVSLSTSQPALCSSITMGSKCTLSVKLGHIVEEAVDAYVNPTNSNLDLINGVSSAINVASRGAVKRECTALMSRRGGPVPPGCVAVTESGGQLKSKWIIHVNVYDTKESSIQGCSQVLLKSLANVLQVAESKHLSSIALTPFFPQPKGLKLTTEMVAHYFIEAIVHSFFPEQLSLKVLVDGEESFIVFQKELQRVSSMITATLPHRAGPSYAMQPSAALKD